MDRAVTATPAADSAPVDATAVLAAAEALPASQLPAYVHDLGGLSRHAAGIAATLPPGIEFYYAAKANPDTAVLRALAAHVDGVEVASGGEYAHVRAAVPELPVAFGGPGKTPDELAEAVAAGVHRLHVESEHELRQVAALARAHDRPVDVLLRANAPVDVPGGVPLAMGGVASPFGMDPDALDRCAAVCSAEPLLRLRGLHAHLASGLDAPGLAGVARDLLAWAAAWAAGHRVPLDELTVGGGMAVDYADPSARFAWADYGRALAGLAADRTRLRIEPGRAVSAYHGWYVTDVLDLKHSRGRTFAVVRGGTHHLRTPAARGHAQPCTAVPVATWPHPWARPTAGPGPVTVVGQLCTPKDVLAADAPLAGLRAGDRIAFAMAGAYAWNISHRDFLMHPPPTFHYLP